MVHIVTLLLLILIAFTPAHLEADEMYTSGEVYFDVYGIVVASGNSDISSVDYTSVPALRTSRHVNFDSTFGLGLRGGGWFYPQSWLGYAIDLSYFQMRAKEDQRILNLETYVPSLLVMVRLIPEDDHFTFYPYLGVGAAVPFTWVTNLDPSPGTTGAAGDTFDRGHWNLDVRAGFVWPMGSGRKMFLWKSMGSDSIDLRAWPLSS